MLLRMRTTKQRDTPCEVALRRTLHRMGYRYSIDARAVPHTRRRADVLLRRWRIAVFVDGCFWHSCPKHKTRPKANAAWWEAKLAANVERDRDTDRKLRRHGWQVIRVWEHEDPERAASRIASALMAKRVR